ncbi:MAG: hypothetical protein ACLUEK_13965 [Oscillospiraceae bacterium]
MKKILPQLRDFVRRADMFLFTVSVICAIYGIIVIASATKSYDNGSAQYVIVQGLALVLGILLFIAITVIDVDIFAQHWAWLYGLSAALLISLIFFGAQTTRATTAGCASSAWHPAHGDRQLAFIIVLAKQLAYLKDIKPQLRRLHRPDRVTSSSCSASSSSRRRTWQRAGVLLHLRRHALRRGRQDLLVHHGRGGHRLHGAHLLDLLPRGLSAQPHPRAL